MTLTFTISCKLCQNLQSWTNDMKSLYSHLCNIVFSLHRRRQRVCSCNTIQHHLSDSLLRNNLKPRLSLDGCPSEWWTERQLDDRAVNSLTGWLTKQHAIWASVCLAADWLPVDCQYKGISRTSISAHLSEITRTRCNKRVKKNTEPVLHEQRRTRDGKRAQSFVSNLIYKS